MTDKEKLEKWNKVCIKNGWASENEMYSWLGKHGVYFTNAGSCVNAGMFSYSIDNLDNVKLAVNSHEEEGLATMVLQVLSGIMIFPNYKTEREFWDTIKERLEKEYKIDFPDEIIPPAFREHIYDENYR
jgi:hypothetical protein